MFLLTESTWSCWIDAELCTHGISPCFTHSLYIISLDRCRIVCWWNLSVFHPQQAGNFVESMKNRVLMESPHFSPTGSTWSCWINAKSCAHAISPCFTHRKYVIPLDHCRFVCSWGLPAFHLQEVRDVIGSMQNRVLRGSPRFSPTACTWSRWINAEPCTHAISLFFTHRK